MAEPLETVGCESVVSQGAVRGSGAVTAVAARRWAWSTVAWEVFSVGRGWMRRMELPLRGAQGGP